MVLGIWYHNLCVALYCLKRLVWANSLVGRIVSGSVLLHLRRKIKFFDIFLWPSLESSNGHRNPTEDLVTAYKSRFTVSLTKFLAVLFAILYPNLGLIMFPVH